MASTGASLMQTPTIAVAVPVFEVHPVPFATIQHVEATMHQAFTMHALAHASLVQQVDADLFKNAARMLLKTYSPVCRSRMTASMPALWSNWPSSSPDGPAPMMATWVLMSVS